LVLLGTLSQITIVTNFICKESSIERFEFVVVAVLFGDEENIVCRRFKKEIKIVFDCKRIPVISD
jgi:hypothetical protein